MRQGQDRLEARPSLFVNFQPSLGNAPVSTTPGFMGVYSRERAWMCVMWGFVMMVYKTHGVLFVLPWWRRHTAKAGLRYPQLDFNNPSVGAFQLGIFSGSVILGLIKFTGCIIPEDLWLPGREHHALVCPTRLTSSPRRRHCGIHSPLNRP